MSLRGCHRAVIAQMTVPGTAWNHSEKVCETGQPPPEFRGREEASLDGRVFWVRIGCPGASEKQGLESRVGARVRVTRARSRG